MQSGAARIKPFTMVTSAAASAQNIVVIMPCLDDWESLTALIKDCEAQALPGTPALTYLAVDDGSERRFDPDLTPLPKGANLHVLRLKANQGHQRAIALGLAYARTEFSSASGFIVMDSDGEDRPADIPSLLAEAETHQNHVVVATRARRSEGLGFRLFYQLYKAAFWLMTGKAIKFGNFSYIPAARLDAILYSPTVWNNFASTVLRSRAPVRFIPTQRGKRYFGKSRMNFNSLMVHGLSAISVYSDIVIGRVITGVMLFAGLIIPAILAVIWVRLFTDILIMGAATNVILFLATILFNAAFIGFVIILLLLNSRTLKSAIPSELVETLAYTPAKSYG